MVRMLVFGVWLQQLVAEPLIRLPPLLSHLDPGQGLLVGQALLVILAVAAVFGIGGSATVAFAAVGLLAYQGLSQGYTLVHQSRMPLVYAALVLAVSPCTDALALWGRRRTHPVDGYRLPLVGIAGLMLLHYTLISGSSLALGKPALFPSDGWLVWGITVIEATAVLSLFSRHYRVFFLWSMISVHTMIWLLMGISFSNEVMLYLVLIDSRRWSPVHQQVRGQLLVLFDGFCSLCDRFVAVLLARDPGRVLRFAPLQGATAAERLGAAAVGPADPETIVVVDGEGLHQRSAAVLRAVSALGGKWAFAAVLGLVPRWIGDRVYDFVARNRYRWFPRRGTCRLPTPEERAVFLP